MELTRRELMKLLGVSAAATAAGAWGADVVFDLPDQVFERVMTGPRIETWKNTVCSLCRAGCGIRVRLIDGVPVRVSGNPLYPVNRGSVCPTAEAGIEAFYHPDRVRHPLKRSGARGENRWQVITWEEALETISQRLEGLRTGGTPERLAILMGDSGELVKSLSARFMRAFGSPNHLCLDDSQAASLPVQLSQGLEQAPVYDLENTNFVLNFGGDFLDEPLSPVRFNQLYATLRERRKQDAGHIVHISSYLSRTAANASEWIPIEPGTMGGLALSIAHVMIKDEAYDEEFVRDHCAGFFDWKDAQGQPHQGFRSLVLDEYYPERIAEYTGVSSHQVVDVARAFSAADSAVAIPGTEALNSTNGLYTSWAIYCLNALKGNLEQKGGVLFPERMEGPSLAKLERHATALKGLESAGIGSSETDLSFRVNSLKQLIDGLHQPSSDSLDTLIIRESNPVFEAVNRERCLKALDSVPFIVSYCSILNDSAIYADLVLPEPFFLERWEGSLDLPAVEFRHFGVQQPVTSPWHETKHFGDFLLEVSKRLGGAIAEALPWEHYESYLKLYAEAVFNTGEGAIVSQSHEYSWTEFLRERGWSEYDYSSFEEFWEVLTEQGAWWSPYDPDSDYKRILKTESGKFEFYSQSFQLEAERLLNHFESESVEDVNLSRNWKLDAHGDRVFLPHFEAPRYRREHSDFPFHFLAYRRLTNLAGAAGTCSLVQELSGLHSREYWHSWVEINPETARTLDVGEDDYVAITSPVGRLVAKAKLLPTVMPNVVVMPLGLGHQISGRYPGLNPYRIFVEETDLLSGTPSLVSTRVQIQKVEGQSKS